MTVRRICLMGDSQLGALKKGWKSEAPLFPEIEFTFFAGQNADWGSIHVADGKLVPGSEELRESFKRSALGLEDIQADFDAYILCSLKLAISFPLRLWTHHEHRDWNSYQAAVREYVNGTVFARVLARLRKITGAPIVVLAGPHQPSDFCKASPLLDNETAGRLHANFVRECEALAAVHNARLVTQPEETLAPNGVTTLMKFANGNVDPRHCNAEYGVIAIRHILKTGLAIDLIAD
jgi:hypothetical protein